MFERQQPSGTSHHTLHSVKASTCKASQVTPSARNITYGTLARDSGQGDRGSNAATIPPPSFDESKPLSLLAYLTCGQPVVLDHGRDLVYASTPDFLAPTVNHLRPPLQANACANVQQRDCELELVPN